MRNKKLTKTDYQDYLMAVLATDNDRDLLAVHEQFQQWTTAADLKHKMGRQAIFDLGRSLLPESAR